MRINASSLKALFVMLFAGGCLLSISQEAFGQRVESVPPKIVRKPGGVLMQTATKKVNPTYPPLAKAARVSGAVVVEVTVDEEGNVMSARAVSGHPLLKDAAVAAARGWMFTPARLSGEPVKVIGTITFNFTPERDPALVQEAETIKEQLRAKPSVDLYLKLGGVLTSLEEHKDAAQAYRQAVMLDEKSIPARKALIRAYFQSGEKEEALEEIAKLKELDPEAAEEMMKEFEIEKR